MIVNFMIPTSVLIVVTTILGTLSLRAVVAQQRQVIVESIENILDKCHHIDAAVNCNWNGEYVPQIKCCEEMHKRSEELQKVCWCLMLFRKIVDCQSIELSIFCCLVSHLQNIRKYLKNKNRQFSSRMNNFSVAFDWFELLFSQSINSVAKL